MPGPSVYEHIDCGIETTNSHYETTGAAYDFFTNGACIPGLSF